MVSEGTEALTVPVNCKLKLGLDDIATAIWAHDILVWAVSCPDSF